METLLEDTQQVHIEMLKTDFRRGNMPDLKERCQEIVDTNKTLVFIFSGEKQLTKDTYVGLFDHYHKRDQLSITDGNGNSVTLPSSFTWFSRNR